MSKYEKSNYNLETVQAWDEASWNFKENCDKANWKTTIAHLFENDWKKWDLKTWINKVEKINESIDWVWTKIQIYTEVFNHLVNQLIKKKISSKNLLEKSVDLWERMLHDLIAMNVDDLRNWEMAVALTNIIDINHLNWIRWKVFSESMWQALYNVIIELDILMTAWETAILKEPKKVDKLSSNIQKTKKELLDIAKNSLFCTNEWKERIINILEIQKWEVEIILDDIEFNIWWTWLWIKWEEKRISNFVDQHWYKIEIWKSKLIKIEEWQDIIYFQEKPDENWIIWPRSNWITRIRNIMKWLVWEWWENLTFSQFLKKIWKKKASKLPERLINQCKWLKMWQIATWKTTIFNPFISRTLLWWLDKDQIVDISAQIHVTWNPWRKISDWIAWYDDLAIDIDISEVVLPQIIEILQILWEITDNDAIWSWNMWIPYIVICDKNSTARIIAEAINKKIIAKKLWTVIKKENKNIVWKVNWVWIGKSEIMIEKEKIAA